ncbi:membrane-bound lytic murein transglycosylase MltF [Alishewanella sp. SMS8]|uniref:membrane-bound lytic murein transglycosylase MltF n=1 Tax=Alishewanella sp. SMS8 TaxID=2994676 RepID=UPI002740C1FA|nr:membrane-bound lytic murein transglycosylase MltF [Alishewanella sp. SMS8]MDP5185781.1 membrane-bound lytic murein transglycosylase MltF [Alishewanella sp.]MDP5459451.1 membrane-bound lytic murein transglycosylase MltF [Alishewanella sp. SMS8]
MHKTLLLLCCCLLFACTPPAVETSGQLADIYQRNSLRVGILHGPTSYYIGVDGPTGFEYELAKALADRLGVELSLAPSFHLDELLDKLETGQVDFIAGGLTLTPSRTERFRAAPPYRWINEVVVYRQGATWPREFADLAGPVVVMKASSHAESLAILQQENADFQYVEDPELDADELLQKVIDGSINYTLTDSNQLAVNRRLFPQLSIAFTLNENLPVGWLLQKSQDDSLYSVLIEYFGHVYQNGDLVTLEDRYFGHVELFDYVDTIKFIQAIDHTLPKFKPLFLQHAGELDWRLLAALSYQESHWNPKARSPTGVRGLMMLTMPTARQMGVDSRLDPQDSIDGGSRYLQLLLTRIPERIPMPDRLWFALASYNIGWGHVEDARRLTQRDGADPDKWLEVKQRLPLLRKKSVYQHTRFGFARGDEAVMYVENIRRYYDTLVGVDERQQLEDRMEQQRQKLVEETNESEESSALAPPSS